MESVDVWYPIRTHANRKSLGISPKDKMQPLGDFRGDTSVKTAAFRVFSKLKSASLAHPSSSSPFTLLIIEQYLGINTHGVRKKEN